MYLSIVEKIGLIFQYLVSSFLSIELFLLCFLFFLFLVINLKYQNKLVHTFLTILFLLFVILLVVYNSSYVFYCIDFLLKVIIDYIYFPSTAIYFLIFCFVTIGIIYTMHSKEIGKIKKFFNYFLFSLLYFFFFSFVAISYYEQLPLADPVLLYQNDTVLSIVQVSNFIFAFWLLVTIFYRLFLFFKKKFDS